MQVGDAEFFQVIEASAQTFEVAGEAVDVENGADVAVVEEPVVPPLARGVENLESRAPGSVVQCCRGEDLFQVPMEIVAVAVKGQEKIEQVGESAFQAIEEDGLGVVVEVARQPRPQPIERPAPLAGNEGGIVHDGLGRGRGLEGRAGPALLSTADDGGKGRGAIGPAG